MQAKQNPSTRWDPAKRAIIFERPAKISQVRRSPR
jgi:hypothetical protein